MTGRSEAPRETSEEHGPASPRGRLGTAGLLALLAGLSVLPDPWAAAPRLAYYFRDLSVTFYPVRLFAARELHEGRLPVWNPYIFEGSFAVPYFHLLDLVQVLRPDPVVFSFLLTLQFPLAALCAYALLRDFGVGRLGAFAAGALYSLGGLARSSANLYVFLQVLALAPVIVLTLRRAASRGGRWVAGAALALALALTTLAVEFVGQALVLGLGLALAERPPRPALGRIAAAVLLGFGMASVAIVPLLGLLPETARGAGFDREVALGHSLPPLGLAQALVPNLFGSLEDPIRFWWGQKIFSRLPYFLSLYVGPLALALAWAGRRRLPPRTRAVVVVAALLGAWFALGEAGGLAPPLLELVKVVRYPTKALLLPYLAITLLLGLGADELLRGSAWPSFGRACLVLAALATVPLTLLALAPAAVQHFTQIPVKAYPAVRLELSTGVAMGMALALLGAVVFAAVGHLRLSPARGTLLVTGALVLDLVRVHFGMNPQADPSFFRPLPELEVEGLGDLGGGRVFSYPLDRSPTFTRYLAIGPASPRLASFFVNRQLLAPYLNVIDEVRAPENRDLTSFTPRPPELRDEDYEPRNVRGIVPWLRQAGVARVLSVDALAHEDLRLRVAVPAGPPGLAVHVYELRDPAPLAYFACAVRVARTREEALAAPLRPGFLLDREVALEQGVAARCSTGSLSESRSFPAERRYRTQSDGPGLLVERESFATGWRATVDGQPARVLRANGKHRAVPVPAGDHEVLLRYEAPGLGLGALLTALSLAASAVLLLRRPPEAKGAPGEGRASPPRVALRLLCPRCGHLLGEASAIAAASRCPACGATYPRADGIVDLRGGTGPGAPGYDPHYFGTLPQVEGTHFWFVHRRERILEALRRHVSDLQGRPLFDVGCGSGGLLAWLEGSGVKVLGGCDAHPETLRMARRRLDAPLLLVDANSPPPLAPGLPLVGFFDVLEHLDDDASTLRWAFSVLEPDGFLVLTVPAHPFLFDEADLLAHHRRRYRRPQLRARLEEAGFEVVHLRHFMALLVPLLLAARFLWRVLPGRLGGQRARRDVELRVIPGLNVLLRGLLAAEAGLGRLLPIPFGTSLVAVARRPASRS
jgi:SAM-dependent methyltransferase